MIHDENKDVRLLSKVLKINQSNKSITIRRDQIIGNRRWGRIDFLTNHCGYHVVREDGVIANFQSNDNEGNKKRNKDELKKKKSNKRMYV